MTEHDRGSAGYTSEDILQHVVGLLDRWGECQRKEPAGTVRPGGHRCMVAVAMEQWGERSRRAARKRNPVAYRDTRRRVTVGEGENARRVPALDPFRRVEQQTRSRKVPMAPPWPDDVQWVERVLAEMPRELLEAVIRKHYFEDPEREAADRLRISRHEYCRRVERAHWLVAGRLIAEAG